MDMNIPDFKPVHENYFQQPNYQKLIYKTSYNYFIFITFHASCIVAEVFTCGDCDF